MSGLVLSVQSAAPGPALPPHNLGPHPPLASAKSVVLLASPWLLDLLSPEGLAASGSLTPFFCSKPSPSPSALAAVYLELSLLQSPLSLPTCFPQKGFWSLSLSQRCGKIPTLSLKSAQILSSPCKTCWARRGVS